MNSGWRISKKEFYGSGGFANPRLYRVTRSGGWAYFRWSP